MLLAMVGGFLATFIGLGLNYTPVRFLAPFALLLFSLRLADRYGVPALVVAPFVSAGISFGLSPEMGIVASIGLATAFAIRGIAGRPAEWIGAASAIVGGVAGTLAYGAGGASMFGAFSAGAVYFPVLPSQMALVYVVTMLVAGWGVGATTSRDNLTAAAPQIAWLVSCFVLVAAALGRADFVHIFWNGSAAILLASALLWTTARRFAPAYPIVVASVFIVAGAIYAWVGLGPGVVTTAVRSGTLTKERSVAIARAFGRSPAMGFVSWKASRRQDPLPADVKLLLDSGGVAPLSALSGKLGMKLALSDALVNQYSPPWSVYSRPQLDRELADLSRAKFLLLPTSEYVEYLRRYDAAKPTMRDGMWVAPLERPAWSYAGMTGFPFSAQPAQETLDVWAVFGKALVEDWRVYKTSGDYTILVRKGP
jgi:hypothetical protein